MSIRDNLELIREEIARAEALAGRPAGSVTLVAVSKFHPVSSVLEAVKAGQSVFGENRVQEAVPKFQEVLSSSPEVSLHLIGSLQRNKVRQIVPLAACIESVDRIELLREIGKHTTASGKHMSILFEIRTGEESKSGYTSEDDLFRSLDLLCEYPFVHCRGLMTLAPQTDNESTIAGSFSYMRRLGEACSVRYPELDFSVLSMGMSSDYKIAIREGSTEVRIGTAIFGERR